MKGEPRSPDPMCRHVPKPSAMSGALAPVLHPRNGGPDSTIRSKFAKDVEDLKVPTQRLAACALGDSSERRFGEGAGPQWTYGSIRVDEHAGGRGLRADKRELAWFGAV